DCFMSSSEVADFIASYATEISAPVQSGAPVTSLSRSNGGYRVTTDQDEWLCETVVLASGAFNKAHVPTLAEAVPSSVVMVTPLEYRNPHDLPDGGVLVVGASATGVQLAHEIQLSGRPVTLAVGEHVRGPRVYRGRDIHWWMDVAGVLDERYDEVDDIVRARRVPSPPLLTLDLSRGEIKTIVWASGFRPDYSWLDVDVLDAKGLVRHDGGVVVDSPGMYLIGTPFLRRRKSSFIDGACDDAQDLIVELASFLDRAAGRDVIAVPEPEPHLPAPRPAIGVPTSETLFVGE